MLKIKEYVSEELCNPAAAANVLSIITKRIRELAKFPLMGAPLSSIIDFETGYRFRNIIKILLSFKSIPGLLDKPYRYW